MHGKVRFSQDLSESENRPFKIFTSNLEKGIYILRIKTDQRNLNEKIIRL
jgi:hypothetical protein